VTDTTPHPPLFAPWAASWRSTVLLVCAVSLLRILYLAFFCPYTLLEDEAHYWDWSRHLDWAYYSKPPGVALLIASSTSIFGHTEFAVRLPAVLCSAALALALAALARGASGDRRAGFFAAALVQLIPLFQSTSLLMTIDMPYAACWAVASWAAWRAFATPAPRWILLAGLAAATGLVFKHTMLLWLPGLLVFAFLHSTFRRPALLIALLCLLGLLPNLIWNAQRDWPTFRHLLGHLGMAGGDVPTPVTPSKSAGYSPFWTLEFFATQIALVGPAMALMLLAWRHASDQPLARRFLVLTGLPIILFYLAITFVTEPEGNWAFAGYTTLTALAAWGLVKGMDDYCARRNAWLRLSAPRPKAGFLRQSPETKAQVAWHATLFVGLVAAFGILRLDLLARLPVVGPRVPLSRLMDADTMANHVQRLADDLEHRTGKLPLIISQFYGRASQLGFYLPGRHVVYCSGSRMNGRKSQFDLWPHTDLANPALAGRPAVLLGDADQDWSWGFTAVERLGKLEGDRKRNREVFLGLEYTPPVSRSPAR
jgi:hypothetical protein